jgi:hypothetical protein
LWRSSRGLCLGWLLRYGHCRGIANRFWFDRFWLERFRFNCRQLFYNRLCNLTHWWLFYRAGDWPGGWRARWRRSIDRLCGCWLFNDTDDFTRRLRLLAPGYPPAKIIEYQIGDYQAN